MIKTESLGLPIYDTPEIDTFDLQDFNDANQSLEGAYNEIIEFKTNIPLVNASAEVLEARKGKLTLKEKIDEVDAQLADIEQDVLNKSIDILGMKKTIKKLDKGETVTIVFFGDSTTEDNVYSTKNNCDLIREWLQGIYGVEKVNIVNKGTGGNTAPILWNRYFEDVHSLNPDCIVMCIGINDCTKVPRVPLADSMKAVNDIFKYSLIHNPNVDIIYRTMNPNRRFNHPSEPLFVEFNQEVKKVCNKYGVLYCDYHTYAEKIKYSMTQAEWELYYADSIHPNDLQHKLIADYLKPHFVDRTNSFESVDFGEIIKCDSTKLTLSSFFKKTGVSDKLNKFANNEYLDSNKVVSAKITHKFFGSSISFMFLETSWASNFEVKLDGSIIKNDFITINTATDLRFTSTFTIDNLTDSEHTLEITSLEAKTQYISGITVKSNMAEKVLYDNGLFGFIPQGNLKCSTNSVGRVMKDLTSGVKIQCGYASCSKNGWVTLPEPYTQGYQVFITQQGGGGQASPTFELVYLTGSSDVELTRFKPNWNSADSLKGINFICMGI